ncbi:hypothetical protein HY29_05780 [Hyphomonas beringensis]|uniref:OmpA-like domain-containing protein n=2 Tax=Hyphomonas beringensis TaxID=1280946 RepID=A0A062U5F4_9PROT|nr:hypothetical protein HY29_05780 [Hyphomonas beringensis]
MMKRAQFIAGLSIGAIALAFPAMSDAPKAPPMEPVKVPYEKNCEDMQITVYFSNQDAALSSYSMRALNTAGDQLAGCTISDIQATIVSADAASSGPTARLSEDRAAVVLDALTARGIRPQDIRTDFVPVSETQLSDTIALPMARRVDLKVKAKAGYGL